MNTKLQTLSILEEHLADLKEKTSLTDRIESHCQSVYYLNFASEIHTTTKKLFTHVFVALKKSSEFSFIWALV